MKHKLAAQLYTLRNELQQDFIGVLHELKAMGWAGVQISGYHGHDPQEIARTVKELGLGVAGMHVSLDQLRNEWEQVAADAKLFGTPDVICPFLAKDLQTEEGYRQVKRELNEAAAKLEEHGLRLSYHNHAFEFETLVDGKDALSYLLEPSPENRILAEIDVYWVKKGGRDPLSYIQTYSNRMPIIHLKDMTDDERQTFAEIGTGTIDFAPILQWGERNGIEWYCVEQDVCPGSPMDSLRLSFENLNRIIDTL